MNSNHPNNSTNTNFVCLFVCLCVCVGVWGGGGGGGVSPSHNVSRRVIFQIMACGKLKSHFLCVGGGGECCAPG